MKVTCHKPNMPFSAISGGIVDRAIEAEDRKHGDFMRIVSYLFNWLLILHGNDNMYAILNFAVFASYSLWLQCYPGSR